MTYTSERNQAYRLLSTIFGASLTPLQSTEAYSST